MWAVPQLIPALIPISMHPQAGQAIPAPTLPSRRIAKSRHLAYNTTISDNDETKLMCKDVALVQACSQPARQGWDPACLTSCAARGTPVPSRHRDRSICVQCARTRLPRTPHGAATSSAGGVPCNCHAHTLPYRLAGARPTHVGPTCMGLAAPAGGGQDPGRFLKVACPPPATSRETYGRA